MAIVPNPKFSDLEGLSYSLMVGRQRNPLRSLNEVTDRGLRTSASLILYEFSLFSQLIFPSSGLSLGNPLILLIYLV